MLLLNAFSLNMLIDFPATLHFEELSLAGAKTQLENQGFHSVVGHADTASVFSDVLGLTVATNRETVVLKKGEVAIVGQYRGPRLEEGAKHLPEGATIQWLRVTV